MIETVPTITQFQRASMSIAVRVLAHNGDQGNQASATRPGAEGSLLAHRHIVALAHDYIAAHPELIAEAKATVI